MIGSQAWLFFATIFILILLELIVIYLIWSYYKLLKTYDAVMAKQRQMEQDVAQKSQELLGAAEAQAQSTILTANTKAQQILTQAGSFNQETQAIIQHSLQVFLSEQTAVYKATFDGVRQEVINYVRELNEAYRQRSDQEVAQISQEFRTNMDKTTKTAQAALAEAYKRIEAEVETYRKQRLAGVDEQVATKAKKILQSVLHQAIDGTTQEKLIMEALDAAHEDQII